MGRLGEEALGSPLVALGRQQGLDGLARRVYSAGESLPLPYDLDGRLVHPPAAPHGARAAVQGLLRLRTGLDAPALDCGVIDRDTPRACVVFSG